MQALGGGVSTGGPRRVRLELLSALTVSAGVGRLLMTATAVLHTAPEGAPLACSPALQQCRCLPCRGGPEALCTIFAYSACACLCCLLQPAGPLPPADAKPTYHDVVATVAEVRALGHALLHAHSGCFHCGRRLSAHPIFTHLSGSLGCAARQADMSLVMSAALLFCLCVCVCIRCCMRRSGATSCTPPVQHPTRRW